MNDLRQCLKCGAPLQTTGEPCFHCLMGLSLETGDNDCLGPGFLDDLPVPDDDAVIADKYRIIEVLGRGSFGIVYKALQLNLNREVAVKTLRDGAFAEEKDKSLFLREAQAIAQLNHPNIVAIYDWGVDRDHPFFSMEYVDGKSLAQCIQETPLPINEVARIIQTVAEAIEAVHKSGLLHRDLKPANILLTSSGAPKITDFGLAKLIRSDSTQTLPCHVLGSPGFMSPEQASGKPELIGPASDIYSLGATLYCLLTGRAPFTSDSIPETLRLVAEAEPLSPTQINPNIPADLATICLKCLQKDPAQRYAAALHLANDLARFLRQEPIQAKPPALPGRIQKWIKRRRTHLQLWALILAVTAGCTASYIFVRRAKIRARAEYVLLLSRADRLRENADAARGNKQNRLFEEAISICKKVIAGETGTQEWGMAQNTLAVVLNSKAGFTVGEEHNRLLAESVAASRAALRVRTYDNNPEAWAITKNNLGLALRAQAASTTGKGQKELLDEALAAYEKALLVFSRQTHRERWSQLRNNMGMVFVGQAALEDGDNARRLFVQSIQAFDDALTVYDRDSQPKMWAVIHSNLASPLQALAKDSAGAQRTDLLTRAITSTRNAIEVFTRDTSPSLWAMLQRNLAILLVDRANVERGAEFTRLVADARDAMLSAATVLTERDYPAQYAAIRRFADQAEMLLGSKPDITTKNELPTKSEIDTPQQPSPPNLH